MGRRATSPMKVLWEKFNNSPFFKFVFVGGLNALVGYSVFAILILLGVHYIAVSIIAHIAGVTNSYFWNKYFTFRAGGQSSREIMRFIGVYTVHYFIGLTGLILFVEIFKLHPLVGQGIVLIITTLFSFFSHKYWTFKTRDDDRQGN